MKYIYIYYYYYLLGTTTTTTTTITIVTDVNWLIKNIVYIGSMFTPCGCLINEVLYLLCFHIRFHLEYTSVLQVYMGT